jgi:phage shock protein C
MITINADPHGRLYRDADRGWLGGVCAGLAGYLGFNLRVTRFLAFIAFLMAMPIAVIAYLAAVFLIPSASRLNFDVEAEDSICRRRRSRRARKARKRHKEADSAAAPERSVKADIDRRCHSMDERLVRLEKLVTSRRFQLEQELSRL